MAIISPSKYLVFHIAAASCLFTSQPRIIAEALVVTGKNSSPLTTTATTTTRNNANQHHPRLRRRRSFLVTLVTACGGCTSASFLLWKAPSVAAAEVPVTNVGSSSSDSSATTSPTFCVPPTDKVLSQKISDTRTQIDMAVQASSVQAFSAAAEIANDSLLDSSSLKTLILESCKNNSNSNSLSQQDLFGGSGDNDSGMVISEILQSVENMRSTLNSPNTLTTEDVKDVMRYGTTARSGIDSIFAL